VVSEIGIGSATRRHAAENEQIARRIAPKPGLELRIMAKRTPSRRVNPWVALSVGIALAILAAGFPRLYASLNRLINPLPPNLIIIAPAGSEIV
jgi:hypothetical protein